MPIDDTVSFFYFFNFYNTKIFPHTHTYIYGGVDTCVADDVLLLPKRLQGKQVSMGGGSSSALFSRSSTQDVKLSTGPSRTLYAIGLLSEYIDEKTSEQLQSSYGLDGVAAAAAAATKVKSPPKSNYSAPAGGSKPLMDYSKGASAVKAAPPKTMSASAKALAKVNKKGMKSMMSFFGQAKKKQKT